MSVGDVIAAVLIVAGTAGLVLAGIGSVLPRSSYVRLHYLDLATMVGAPLVLLGVLVHDPADWVRLLLIIVLLVGTSPAASAATARAVTRSGGGYGEGS